MTLTEKLNRYADDPMWADHAEVPKSLLREAAAALEAAREDGADAERYRFLRDKCNHIRIGWHIQFSTQDASLDAAIDQARGKAGQEVGNG